MVRGLCLEFQKRFRPFIKLFWCVALKFCVWPRGKALHHRIWGTSFRLRESVGLVSDGWEDKTSTHCGLIRGLKLLVCLWNTPENGSTLLSSVLSRGKHTFSAKGSYFLRGVFIPATALCLWYFICPQNVLSTFPSFQASLAHCHLTTLQGLFQESSFHEALLHTPIITVTTTALAGRDRSSSFSLLKTSISSTAITLLTVYLKVLVVCFGYCLLICLFVFV